MGHALDPSTSLARMVHTLYCTQLAPVQREGQLGEELKFLRGEREALREHLGLAQNEVRTLKSQLAMEGR